MTEPSASPGAEGPKSRQCPECGKVSEPDKRVCFGCGYIFNEMPPAKSTLAGKTATTATAPGEPPGPGLLEFAKPLIIGLVVIVGLIALLWPTISERLHRNKADAHIERAISETLGKQRSHLLWQAKADHGLCRVVFLGPVPLDGAAAFAAEVAARYSELRRGNGESSRVIVEVLNLNAKFTAEAEDGRVVDRGFSVRDLSSGKPVATTHRDRLNLSGPHIILIIWVLLCVAALVLWRMVR